MPLKSHIKKPLPPKSLLPPCPWCGAATCTLMQQMPAGPPALRLVCVSAVCNWRTPLCESVADALNLMAVEEGC